MKDIEIKKKILNDGTYTKLRKLNNQLYKNGSSIENEINQNIYKDSDLLQLFDKKDLIKIFTEEYAKENNITYDELINFKRLKNNKKYKRKVIQDLINYALNYSYMVVFATLTFNDNYLSKTKRTRRNYEKNYLEQYSGYIANIDYGTLNEREHYHALIFINPINIDKFTYEYHYDFKKKRMIKNISNFEDIMNVKKYKYGYTCFQLVEQKKDKSIDYEKLSNYVATLTNHAIKVEQQQILKNTKKLVDLKKYEEFKHEEITLKF